MATRETLTIEEAAQRLGIGRRLAYDAARRGELPVIRIGRRILVPVMALDAMLAVEVEPGALDDSSLGKV